MDLKFIVLLATTIILLFAVMILSAHSAALSISGEDDASYQEAHKYSTYSAVVTGLATLILMILLGAGLYANSKGGSGGRLGAAFGSA